MLVEWFPPSAGAVWYKISPLPALSPALFITHTLLRFPHNLQSFSNLVFPPTVPFLRTQYTTSRSTLSITMSTSARTPSASLFKAAGSDRAPSHEPSPASTGGGSLSSDAGDDHGHDPPTPNDGMSSIPCLLHFYLAFSGSHPAKCLPSLYYCITVLLYHFLCYVYAHEAARSAFFQVYVKSHRCCKMCREWWPEAIPPFTITMIGWTVLRLRVGPSRV